MVGPWTGKASLKWAQYDARTSEHRSCPPKLKPMFLFFCDKLEIRLDLLKDLDIAVSKN